MKPSSAFALFVILAMNLALGWASLFNPLFYGWVSWVFLLLSIYGWYLAFLFVDFYIKKIPIPLPVHFAPLKTLFQKINDFHINRLNKWFEWGVKLNLTQRGFVISGIIVLSFGVLGNTAFNEEIALSIVRSSVQSISGLSSQNSNYKTYLVSISMKNNEQCEVLYGFPLSEANCMSTSTNREHLWPSSLLPSQNSVQGDLHHVWLGDERINQLRGNNTFGEIKSNPDHQNGVSGSLFEPMKAFKGDIARALFYVAIKYQLPLEHSSPLHLSWTEQEKKDYISMLLDWHQLDPVSDFERQRTSAIEQLVDHPNFANQSPKPYFGRNPFIDYPHYAWMIWG